MSVTPAMLRQLHRLHRQISDLKSRLAQGPRAVARSQAALSQNEEELAEAKDRMHKVKKWVNEQQAQLQQRETRIEELKGRLPGCTSNKEYTALDEQIAADEQASSVLADEIFERLEKLEELEAEVQRHLSACETARGELRQVEEKTAEKRASLDAEMLRVQGELEKAESVLPGDFLQDYRRISAVRGEEALAAVEGGTCGGCFHTLTPQNMNLLHMGRPVICICGCILYLPEDAELPG